MLVLGGGRSRAGSRWREESAGSRWREESCCI